MRTVFLFFILTILLVIPNNFAATKTWNGGTGTGLNWTTAINWSPTGTPAAGDDIIFNTAGTITFSTLPGNISYNSLTIFQGTITLAGATNMTFTLGGNAGTDFTVHTGASLTIGNNVNITLAANATADISGLLTINAGRTLTAGGSGAILNIRGTVTNNGTYNSSTTSAVTNVTGMFNNSGLVSNSSTARLNFSSGSTYQHSQNGGTIPTATWNFNSTCLITGMVGITPGGLTQTFGNLTWNCIGQTANTSTPNSPLNIQGDLLVQSTGFNNREFRMGDGINTVARNYTQTGGNVRIGSNTARTINIGDNLSISGGTLLISSGSAIGTLNIAGNFSHTGGTITETGTGSGSIVFNGTNNQSYTGGGTVSNTINFTLNNPAGLNLATSVTFPATLTMTSGNIITGTNTLTLGTGTGVLGSLSRTSGTIIGNFRRWFSNTTISNVLFPIGTASNYRPANISFTSSPTSGGTLTAFFTASNPGTAGLPLDDAGTQIINAGVDGYWTINAATLTGGTYSLDLTADGFTDVTVVSTLRILKRPTGGGNWTMQGSHSVGTGTTTTPVVHRTGMSGFSEFGIGGASDNALPVELSSFSASVVGNAVKLNWRTETEVNNYGFEVERCALNAERQVWEKIGFVNGNGNSNSPKSYSFEDKIMTAGKYSYRLKQIDNDGQFEYSKTIEVDLGAPKKFVLSQNYPNPFNPTTTIKFSLPEAGNVNLTVYNILGQEVKTLVNEFKESGIHTINFDATELNSGIYIYKLESGSFTQTRKMTLVK